METGTAAKSVAVDGKGIEALCRKLNNIIEFD
jgi:hypothetical protein